MAHEPNIVEPSGMPQVSPGTMLKVEEGQVCAVLCATDEGISTAAAGHVGQGCRPLGTAAASVTHGSSGATAYSSVGNGHSPTVRGGVGSEPSPKGGSSSAAPGGPCSMDGEGEDGFEDDFADGCTATAGDGSSSAGDETDAFSELSEPGGTEVVFVREGVAVWPGGNSERILGRLSLVKQCNVLFMAWLPYSRGVLQEDGTFRVAAAAAASGGGVGGGHKQGGGRDGAGGNTGVGGGGGAGGPDAEAGVIAPGSDRTLYAVHPIPLSEVKALRRRTPPLGLGCPSLVVVLTSGVTLPPLHFQRGGVKALISTLKQHVFLLKSSDDPHTYLVNDTADPLSRSLSALQLSDVLIGGPPPGASATFKPGEGVVAEADADGTVAGVGAGALSPSTTSRASSSARAPSVTWATPATGLGLAMAAGLGADAAAGGFGGGRGGGTPTGGGLGLGLGWGLGLGSAVSWCWADPQQAATAAAGVTAAGLGGFEAVDGRGGDDEADEADAAAADADDGSAGGAAAAAARARQPNAWAYGIVDAINRFVQNVRGTASGWIGALDELDEQDPDLYDNIYTPLPYDEVEMTTPSGRGRAEGGDSPTRAGPCRGAAAGGTSGSSCTATDGARTAASAAHPAPSPAPFPAAIAAAPPPDGPTAAGDASDVNTAVGDFELLDSGGCWGDAAAHPPLRRRVRPPPLSPEEWAAMFDAEGRLVGEAAMRDRVTSSGCAPELRREVWKHLLGMYPRGSTAAQRADTARKWQTEYQTLRQQWQSMVPAQVPAWDPGACVPRVKENLSREKPREARCGSWRCHRIAVDKDVRRTDRGHPFFAREGCTGLRALRNVLLTHVVYDRDLGYCQGMSDLAAPLLVVMRDEAEAFWAFAALMERLGSNFHSDLQGMTLQLAALRRLVQLLDPPLHEYFERRDCLSYYFAFRWLLIHFKREFKFEDVLSLWEACWACRRTRQLHLYLAVAVLVQHRRVILSSELDFDGMLRLSIGLAGKLELQPLLETAQALVGYAGEAGREVTASLA